MDRLSNTVRPYAWGSTTAIPDLLGTAPTGEPQAEMWMGAHPGAPSGTEHGPLNEVIAADPAATLGPASLAKFGPRLPFLLKVLAAAAPLSLQVHPNLAQAQEGYAAEEAAHIPRTAPHRNYKDSNHKPELICALTPFTGFCGFRPPAEAADLFESLRVDALKPYADALRATPQDAALREVLTAILTADRTEGAAVVTEAAAACERLADSTENTAPADATAPGRDATAPYALYASLARHFPGDPGVLAAMLLNPVRLQPGEAMFLGAGVPHAYLEGLGVEILANSDNVLRCGLTPKHVDVPELLRVVDFTPAVPAILRPEASETGEELYEIPVDDFSLARHVLPAGAAPRDLTLPNPQILLCTAGTVTARNTAEQITLKSGESVFVRPSEPLEISGVGTIFRATVVA
ncbi:mannose-6-phosphate isomerase, class I [Streptomyces sp. NPDC050504]|uniref:mannose-6-phosphate isomerase, class I n=1 Tax=Streptomyces sp. NPDC050504 TaxID=3365618 RepID=UPI0037A84927